MVTRIALTIVAVAVAYGPLPGRRSGKWYIVYHCRPLGETDRNHRVVCIDELRFAADGRIEPVRLTTSGVEADPLL